MQENWLSLSYIYKKSLLKHIHQMYYQTDYSNTDPRPVYIETQSTILDEASNLRWKDPPPLPQKKNKKKNKKKKARLSFEHRGTLLWSALPNRVKNYDNINRFKSHIKHIHMDINNSTFEIESSSILNKDKRFHYY